MPNAVYNVIRRLTHFHIYILYHIYDHTSTVADSVFRVLCSTFYIPRSTVYFPHSVFHVPRSTSGNGAHSQVSMIALTRSVKSVETFQSNVLQSSICS